MLSARIPGKVGSRPRSCAGTLYRNRPEGGTKSSFSRLYYKRNQPGKSGAKWDNYGDQAVRGPAHYNYLIWTWPNQPNGDETGGGGQIRAVIASGTYVRACAVAPVALPMYPKRSQTPVGVFQMRYGAVRNAAQVVYGWFAVAWQYKGKSHPLVETARPG